MTGQKASNQSYVAGSPIKKLIKSRLVDVNKLENDVRFLAETDKYVAIVNLNK